LGTVTVLVLPFSGQRSTQRIIDGADATQAGGPNWELAALWHPLRAYERTLSTVVRPRWLPDGSTFWYRYLTSEGWHFWLVDPSRGSKSALFNHARLALRLSEETGTPYDSNRLDLEIISVSESADVVSFSLDGVRYAYDVIRDELSAVEQPEESPPHPYCDPSPDGSFCVFQRGNDLYLTELTTSGSHEVRLSADGQRGYAWGEEPGLTANGDDTRRSVGALWSPDSRRFAVLRTDSRAVSDLWLVEHLSQPRPTLRTFKYAMPGEPVPQRDLWTYEVATQRLVKIDTDRWKDQTLSELFGGSTWWTRDATTLLFTRRSRDYKQVDLCAADPSTGKSKVLVEERMDDQVYIKDPVEVEEGLLWWSMRDGWGHYYLYTSNGQLVRQVTHGDFNVDTPVSVDTMRGRLYVSANGRESGRNPYYRHLYAVNLDGSETRLLTPADAEHEIGFAPSHEYFVDNYSRVDQPTRSVLRSADGELILELERADVSLLVHAGWRPPEVFTALSADDTTLQWGVTYKPFDFSPERSYPIITHVYPGRFSEFIPRSFAPFSFDLMLAQLGFVVIQHGNRGGTPERGLKYRIHGRNDFRDYGLADKRAVIEQLAERYPYVDAERVGIYGGSSGGFMTTSAMLVYPELFKVGVALSAPQDPAVYEKQWLERYTDALVSADSVGRSNIELADRLQGRLLLIQGAQDDNVHPAHLYRLADVLIRAGKRFDMLVIPGADHGLGSWQYFQGRVLEYFAEHLLDWRPTGATVFGSEVGQ
ncbi:MAG: DPP IV N-terminal domain-containing protein, partial [Gemmatimonadales bacterium]